MEVVSTAQQMRAASDAWRATRESIGFVPTMGALHDGHISLVERSRAENARTVVSIFVNPLQFGPNEDFDRYPRDLERDAALLSAHGVDAIYAPSTDVMYPGDALTRVRVDDLGDRLEGQFRPGFFEGVATVVAKLLNAVRPDRAYFGEKDAQQLAVVTRLARDLDTGVEIHACPIVRERDGLALSSRNAYLSTEERRAALALSRALQQANAAYLEGECDPAALQRVLCAVLDSEPLARVDYAEVVDPVTFEPLSGPARRQPRAVLAVRIGGTRLIDNHLLGTPFTPEPDKSQN